MTIDTDKLGDGLSMGDVFFDVRSGGDGVFGSFPLTIVATEGIDAVSPTVVDGGTTLRITFSGFDPGDKLYLSVDVDEQGFRDASAVAEGNEFEGSILAATFTAPHYYEAAGQDEFLDYYDSKLRGTGLDLPPDDYVPPSEEPRPVHTAGAVFSLQQEPLPVSIEGTVFEDLDLDDRQDGGEPGLGGVALRLYESTGGTWTSVDTAVTDSHGEYRFDGLLPGTYRVVEVQPNDYLSVGATAGQVGGQTRGRVVSHDEISQIELLGGDDSVGNDFAETRPASLSGHVYHDADNDGRMDPGETGIGGVTLHVRQALGGTLEVTTDADGYWEATGLYPSEYSVTEIHPDGYLDGLDAAGTAGGVAHNPGDRIDGVQLAGGQSGENYDFGELVPSSISGRVIADADANGTYEPGDSLLAGVTVYLLDASGSRIAETLTDDQGEYLFTGLAPGVYGVEEIQPDDYFDGPDHVGSEGGRLELPDSIVAVALASGTAAVRYDFYELEPVSLSGHVYVDENADGVRDGGEAPIGGVTLELLDEHGDPTGVTTTTDASGFYLFDDLAPQATYGVAEAQPAGYYDGLDAAGTAGGTAQNPGDRITGALLAAGFHAENYNFGELRAASLSGYVYVDENADGVRDGGEAPIGGVTLELLDEHGDPTGVTTTTDASGFYLFDDLAPQATYGVAEAQPAGYYDGLDAAGTAGGTAQNPGDRITGALLAAGFHAENYNFGELEPASISGRVHAELDGDCIPDPGEPLLAGVTVYLLDKWGHRIDSTVTNADGIYRFGNLEPGTYGVEEVQPEGYFDGNDHVGSAGGKLDGDDRISGAKLTSGVDAIDYNFCELVPASISGYVFQDGPAIEVYPFDEAPDPFTLRDGQRTPDDKPIAGVVVRLGDATGQPIYDALGRPREAVTDKHGHYEFDMLEPGSYTVFEVQPEGYVDSVDTPGSLGGVAVNPNAPVSLGPLTVDPNDDAILRVRLSPGDKAVEYNFSEVVVVDVPFYIPPDRPHDPPLPAPRATPGEPAPSSVAPPRYVASPGVELPPMYGGGGVAVVAYTWHLSVVNAGQPRREGERFERTAVQEGVEFSAASWMNAKMDRSEWVLTDDEGEPLYRFRFGAEEGIPVTGDFDGDGVTEVGVFQNGVWFLDLNGNGVWDEGDLWVRLGAEGDLPVTGDWDGDGKTDLGIFGPVWQGDARAIAAEPGLPDVDNLGMGRPKNLPPEPDEATAGFRAMRRTVEGELRADVIDHVFQYGRAGDVPVSGDWNGDGIANIGLYREGTWFLDADGNGRWSIGDEYIAGFGGEGALPVVGDFNGDGLDDLGVYRSGVWRLDVDGDRALTAHDRIFELGTSGDKPIVGDFNGDGVDQPGVYRPTGPPAPQQAQRTGGDGVVK